MTDEAVQTPDAVVEPVAQPAVTEPAAQTPDTQPETIGETGRTFTQADVDKIIKERLDREKARSEAAAKKAADEAARQAAEEQGKFKELYEGAMKEKQEAEARAKALELSNLRRDIASKVGLPAGLAGRLKGETETDIETDAKELLATLPKPSAPNLDGGAGRNGQGATGPTLDEIKEQAARLNVNWKHLAAQYGVTIPTK